MCAINFAVILMLTPTLSNPNHTLTSLQPILHSVNTSLTDLIAPLVYSLNTSVNILYQPTISMHLINPPCPPILSMIGVESMLSRGLKSMEVSVSEAPQQTAR